MGLVAILFNTLLIVLEFIRWVVIVWVIVSWILFFASQTSFRWRYKTAYNIFNQLNDIFSRMTYPFLRRFRRLLPPHKTAGIDWSPLLLLLVIFILESVVVWARGAILLGSGL